MRMRLMALGLVFVTAAVTAPAPAAAQQHQEQERQRAKPHYRQGLQFLRMEAWADAAKAFGQAIDVDPTFEMAYYGLGRALMPQRQYAQAVAAFTKSRDLFQAEGGRQFTNQQEAQRYRRDRLTEIDDVIRQYQQGPQTGQVQEAVRQLQQQKRDIQERVQRGMNGTVDVPIPAYLSLALGSAYFRLGKLTDAEREYKAAINRDPKIGEAHNNLAVVYLELGQFADAERAVSAAEKAGFKVNPQLVQDIKDRKGRS
jgi:tetratricopeptide (TPR) repeat protein